MLSKVKPGPVVTAFRTVEPMWEAPSGANAPKAHQAINALGSTPKEALELLRKQVRAEALADERQIAKWIEQLEDRRFARREQATRELERLGPLAESAMKKALEGNPSLDAKRRLETLLAGLGLIVLSPEQVHTCGRSRCWS